MSMPESDDDDSMNDLLSGSISSTPTPGGPVVERTATCNVLLAEKPRARLRWKPTTIVECTNKKGRTTQSVPFLEDLSNWMDIRLAHQVLTDKPFQAPHGKTVEKWKVSAFFLSKAVDPDGNSVFPNGINHRQLKDRFNDIMAFMKRLESQVPMRSGCDDEADPTDLQQAFEELLELSSAVSDKAAICNASMAATRAEDKRKADVLRKSSLGELSIEELRDLRAGKKKKARPTCVSPGANDGDLAALDAGRSERREAKIRDREEKNRLKTEKLALEAKKLEIDVVEKERAFKLQEQNMKMQAEYFQFFKEQFSRRESDGNSNRGASNEAGDE